MKEVRLYKNLWGNDPSSYLIHDLFEQFPVAVRMLRHRVDDRREDVQHEDHGRRQARHEKNCSRTGSPVPQKPRAERRPGGGV